MKFIKSVVVIFLLSYNLVLSQTTMHDFTVTDSHGQIHRLYADYLDQDKVVVIKFFFTTCPPCIANAPHWQQKYIQWGAGNQNVEFFSATVLISDNDTKVNTFENTYQQTMKAISNDGNAPSVVDPFRSGLYGSWWGTPSFAVIAPNKTLQYPVFFEDLDNAINLAKNQSGPAVTTVNIQLETDNVNIPDGHIKLFMKPKNALTPKIEVVKTITGAYSITYPSVNFPEMIEPEIVMESFAPAYSTKLTAADVVAIQKHILGLQTLGSSNKILAADVNNDGKLTATDLLNIKKVILGLISSFPNNTPSYKAIPTSQTVLVNPGNAVSVNFIIVKTGNVN